MSKVPPPRSKIANSPSFFLSSPYASAAAVGSLRSRRTLSPARRAASLVACRWASSKYAGTVMTAPSSGPSRAASARTFSALRISAETSIGVTRRSFATWK